MPVVVAAVWGKSDSVPVRLVLMTLSVDSGISVRSTLRASQKPPPSRQKEKGEGGGADCGDADPDVSNAAINGHSSSMAVGEIVTEAALVALSQGTVITSAAGKGRCNGVAAAGTSIADIADTNLSPISHRSGEHFSMTPYLQCCLRGDSSGESSDLSSKQQQQQQLQGQGLRQGDNLRQHNGHGLRFVGTAGDVGAIVSSPIVNPSAVAMAGAGGVPPKRRAVLGLGLGYSTCKQVAVWALPPSVSCQLWMTLIRPHLKLRPLQPAAPAEAEVPDAHSATESNELSMR